MLYITATLLVVFATNGLAVEGLRNPNFDSNIYEWLTCLWNNEQNPTPGTAEWSSLYGGSAHLAVSGSPGAVGILAPLQYPLPAGNQVTMTFYCTDMSSANCWLGIGTLTGDTSGGCGQRVEASFPQGGPYTVTVTANRNYPIGAGVSVALMCWPGSAEMWVTSAHANCVGVDETGYSGQPQKPQISVNNNPSIGSVRITFSIPRAAHGVVEIRNVTGRLVTEIPLATQDEGLTTVFWNGRDALGNEAPEGNYFACVKTDAVYDVQKVVLVRR